MQPFRAHHFLKRNRALSIFADDLPGRKSFLPGDGRPFFKGKDSKILFERRGRFMSQLSSNVRKQIPIKEDLFTTPLSPWNRSG